MSDCEALRIESQENGIYIDVLKVMGSTSNPVEGLGF